MHSNIFHEAKIQSRTTGRYGQDVVSNTRIYFMEASVKPRTGKLFSL